MHHISHELTSTLAAAETQHFSFPFIGSSVFVLTNGKLTLQSFIQILWNCDSSPETCMRGKCTYPTTLISTSSSTYPFCTTTTLSRQSGKDKVPPSTTTTTTTASTTTNILIIINPEKFIIIFYFLKEQSFICFVTAAAARNHTLFILSLFLSPCESSNAVIIMIQF